jgi:hypothetical protein
VELLLGHPIPPVGLWDWVVIREHREWHGGSVPQKEPYFLPPVRGFGHGKVEVWIDAMPGLDVDDRASQNRHFRM